MKHTSHEIGDLILSKAGHDYRGIVSSETEDTAKTQRRHSEDTVSIAHLIIKQFPTRGDTVKTQTRTQRA